MAHSKESGHTTSAPFRRTRKAGIRQASQKSLQTHKRILAAAVEQCATKGYDLTKISDIADAAGIHLSALYYYFDTKDELFKALVIELSEESAAVFKHTLNKLPADLSPLARLDGAIRAHLADILRPDVSGRAYFQIVQQAPAEIRAYTRAETKKRSDLFRELFDAAARAGEIKPDINLTFARMILSGAMNWAVEWFREGSLSVDDFADALIQTLFQGIGAAAPARQRTKSQAILVK